jgi:hypothetical protein
VENFVEKSLQKVCQDPHPLYDFYTWTNAVEPDVSGLTVKPDAVRNLSKLMTADGTLQWDVPAGDWIVLRTALTPTGTKNGPAPPEATGLEVDKMNRVPLKSHFDAYVGNLLKRVPAAARKSWKHVVADSYETGPENWTDGFAADFQKRYGYDPLPFVPVMTGRIVGSVDQSDRFLWDLRRLVADRIAEDYVGGLRDLCHEHGLKMWLENYGHWGFPGEFLVYGGDCDEIGGEFWANGNFLDERDTSYLGRYELRDASSAANIYGKPVTWAEAFTGGPAFISSPCDLKARGDWAFCQGINQFVFHVYIHQPTDEKLPGINAGFGTEFNRNNTWFEQSKAWIDYLRRCSVLLQTGKHVADVAYFISEDAPKMVGPQQPTLPLGFDFDFINADVIKHRLAVKDGRLVLPDGMSYRLLALPQSATMRPELLKKIRELVKAGATVVGAPPSRSPSLENFPRCDEQVRQLAVEIWGAEKLAASGEHVLGKGRVIWGKSLTDVFAERQTPPDFECRDASSDAKLLFTHRHSADADIYFVSNQKERTEQVNCVFRVVGRKPELWDAVTGERRALPQWSETNGQTIVPLIFAPNQSWFVVFRELGRPVASSAQNFSEASPVVALTNSWQVSFDPKWGGPEYVEFAQLTDWTTNADEGIKFYSGTAVYRTKFDLSASALSAAKEKIFLDLGKVCDVATVRLNGKELGTLWTPPWSVDISAAAKVGSNSLEIAVVNPWNNRLVGDANLPAERRLTSLSASTVKPGAPLQSAGLLGPVMVQSADLGK